MIRKEIKLDKETTDFRIEAYTYNVNVYTDNIPNPVVYVKGDIILKNDWCKGHENKYATIEEKNKNIVKNTRIFKNGFMSNVFSYSKTVVISRNGQVTVNGYDLSNDGILEEEEIGSIDLVIPNGENYGKHNVDQINIKTMSGDISAKDLNIGNNTSPSSFRVETMSGDITLERFQAMSTKLVTMSGDISAEIYESYINYDLNLSALAGQIEKTIQETKEPQYIFDDRYYLDAETTSGDIKVYFKGKN